MNEKQLARLIKQNVAKAEQAAKKKLGRFKDPTLSATQGESDLDEETGIDRQHFFKEMRKREF